MPYAQRFGGESPRRARAAPSPAQGLKTVIRRVLPAPARRALGGAWVRARIKAASVIADPLQLKRPAFPRECPICGYRGRFWSYGVVPRANALCPACFSLERHRLLQLLFSRLGRGWLEGQRVLHFAPEGFLRARLAAIVDYVTADVAAPGVDCRCAMESIPFADQSFDTVIANHVLEHVSDDLRAMREIRRVLKRGGLAILSVPLVQGWRRTYEDSRIVAARERRVHFGQEDHRRFYGRDFPARLARAGFAVEVFQADPRSEVAFGLARGDKLFLARRGPQSRP